MPDPISSSSALPTASGASSSFDDDPSLTCHSPSAPLPAANVCASPQLPAEPATSTPSALAQKFSSTDHTQLISASSPPRPAPSAPPALTVRPYQAYFQTGLPRLESRATIGDLHLSTNVDVLNVNAHLGTLNEDGSKGANAGWGANLLNGELTLDYKGWSVSIGAGESLGGSIASGGGRDSDGDGVQERCFKMTLGPFTLGECDEL
ncbi:MAG: hypothetical protein ABW061_29440 [Polyangiaceae bacterium]